MAEKRGKWSSFATRREMQQPPTMKPCQWRGRGFASLCFCPRIHRRASRLGSDLLLYLKPAQAALLGRRKTGPRVTSLMTKPTPVSSTSSNRNVSNLPNHTRVRQREVLGGKRPTMPKNFREKHTWPAYHPLLCSTWCHSQSQSLS